MLDARLLRDRLIEAMDDAQPRVTAIALAKACDVTPQAVHGWRTDGRIAKRHLATISRLTRRPLEFFLGSEASSEGRLDMVEAHAIALLRQAHPDWRRYVLGLATITRSQQELMLHTMLQTVPDYVVERAYGKAPHVTERSEKPEE